MISPGNSISNKELVQKFDVGNMGGMRRSLKNNLLVLISDYTKGLYQDRWEGDVLHYTGMGKSGDQTISSQNRTLKESTSTGVTVHLFEVFTPGNYIYVGQVDLTSSPYQEDQVGDDNSLRKVWMFPLRIKNGNRPLPKTSELELIKKKTQKKLRERNVDELKVLAKTASNKPSSRQATSTQYIRDEAVSAYVKQAASGHCDLCGSMAPFQDKEGRPYLENHHVIHLADGGIDGILNAVALCPNCHRRMHSLKNQADINKLLQRIEERDQ